MRHWCSDAMLAAAFIEFERFDLRVEKLKFTRVLREALWQERVTTKEGAKVLLWGVPVVTGSVIEVHGEMPPKDIWPNRKVCPRIRLTRGTFEMNFRTTPEQGIRQARVHRVPYQPATHRADA